MIFEITPDCGDPGLSVQDQRIIEEKLLGSLGFLHPNDRFSLIRIGSDGSSRWFLTTSSTRISKKFYVRITCGGGDCGDRFTSAEAAIEMTERARFGGYSWVFKLTIDPRMDDINRYSAGVQSTSDPSSDWIIVEVQEWHDKTRQLESYLASADIDMANELADTIQEKVHSLRPTNWDLGLRKDASRPQYKDMVGCKYEAFMRDILNRVAEYNPIEMKHPVISPAEQSELMNLGKKLVLKNLKKSELLRALHGDLHCRNILIDTSRMIDDSESYIRLIDFSRRVRWGHPGWDDGRLIADLLEHYLQTGNERIRQFTEAFIERSQDTLEDPHYRQALCLGIFSMTWIKLSPAPGARPIRDPRLARSFLENSLRILRQGYFSW